MLTAILPLFLGQGPFWSSEKGAICAEKFLSGLAAISEIERIYLLSTDNQANLLAKQYNMTVLPDLNIGTMDRLFTFSQTIAQAINVRDVVLKPLKDIIILDHRNLFLTPNEIKQALSIYQHHQKSSVISLSLCQDNPCQFRSFFTFVGCSIFHFRRQSHLTSDFKSPIADLKHIIRPKFTKFGNIIVTVYLKKRSLHLSIDCQEWSPNSLIAHVLPFDAEGPLYKDIQEIIFSGSKIEPLHGLDIRQLSGIVVKLIKLENSGSYDTVECFVPENASWELGTFGNTVIDKKSHQPIYGRQQFPSVYIYDGSFCVVSAGSLDQSKKMTTVPMILDRSCIVTDWVEYWHYASS